MDKILLLGAQMETFRALKDNSLKITFETNELTPEQKHSVMDVLNKFGYLAFKVESFTENETQQIEGLQAEYTPKGEKSASQRLRNVLYRWYEQDEQGFKSFTLFYEHHMELLIKHIKNKL